MTPGLKRQNTFIQRNQPIGLSICHRYLPLLGFPQVDYLNKDLFVQPNREAFYQVIHFMFGLLDKKRGAKEFRDCYPIIDKKAEASFRQIAINWYTELSNVPENGLFKITASVFQFPGGGKFIEFINQFVRFVSLHYMKKHNTDRQKSEHTSRGVIHLLCKIRDLKCSGIEYRVSTRSNKIREHGSILSSILKGLLTENMEYTKAHFLEINKSYKEGKILTDNIADQYRKFLETSFELIEEEKRLKSLIQEKVESKSSEIYATKCFGAGQPEERLENICRILKANKNKQLQHLSEILALIECCLTNIEVFTDFARTHETNTCKSEILNVTSLFYFDENTGNNSLRTELIGDAGSSKSFLFVVEKLASLLKCNACFMLPSDCKVIRIPRSEILSTGSLIHDFKMKFQTWQKNIENYLQNENVNISTLEKGLKNIEWLNISTGSSDDLECKQEKLWDIFGGPILPPMPQIEIVRPEEQCKKAYFSNEDNASGQRPFLLSNFGMSTIPFNDDGHLQISPLEFGKLESSNIAKEANCTDIINSFCTNDPETPNTATKLKLDAVVPSTNPVMSSTVMHGHLLTSVSSIPNIPFSPISPMAKLEHIFSQLNFQDYEIEKRRSVTSGEVHDRMNEYITKLNDSANITGLDDGDFTILDK